MAREWESGGTYLSEVAGGAEQQTWGTRLDGWNLKKMKDNEEIFFFFFFLWPCHTACRILIPPPGIEPVPLQWKHGVLTIGFQGIPNEEIFLTKKMTCIEYLQEHSSDCGLPDRLVKRDMEGRDTYTVDVTNPREGFRVLG